MLPARLPRSRLSRGVGSGAWVPAWPALDAVSAARAAQSGRACGASKGRDGAVEAIRALMVAKRSAAGDRTQTNGQARALVLTGPDDLRARFTGHTAAALVAELASLRPRPGSTVGYATRIALRELGRRAEFPGGQLERLDELIAPLVTARAPGLLALYGIGPHTAALLLIAAGDHPGRLRSEAAWAHLCGAAPIPASSGKTVRRRLNPGADRQANHALWRIVFTRLGSDPATRAYAERRTAEGKSKPPGFHSWLPHNRDSVRGQPGMLAENIADLDPDHHRGPGRPRARRPRAVPGGEEHQPGIIRPGRAPGKSPGPAGHGRSGGCGPGRWGRSRIGLLRTSTSPFQHHAE